MKIRSSIVPAAAAMFLFASATFAVPPASIFQRPWIWKDEHGAVVSFSKWKGSPLIVTMIYTTCKFRCPLTLHKLQKIDAAYARRGRSAQFLVVTLDPRSDSPDRLSAFKKAEHLPEDSWHLLSGSEAQTRELSRVLHIHPAYDDGHIDHEVRIVVYGAGGELVRSFQGWNFDEEESVLP